MLQVILSFMAYLILLKFSKIFTNKYHTLNYIEKELLPDGDNYYGVI
jgi:hypothetical protein